MIVLLADGTEKEFPDSYVPKEGEIIILPTVDLPIQQEEEKDRKIIKGVFKYVPIALLASSLAVLIIKRKTIF